MCGMCVACLYTTKAGVKSRDAKEDVKQETKQGSSAVKEKAGTCVCVRERGSRNVLKYYAFILCVYV
jgi:hypothetical protein